MSLPRPRESADRCALQAQLRGDPMLGTALASRRLLLVEQDGPWGPRGLVESRADAEVATRIDELAAAGGARMQAIRRPGRHAERGEAGHLVCLADVAAATTWWWRVASLAELADQLASRPELRAPEAVADTEPIWLVCTHGRHDACCALRGRPVARELAKVRPGRVWETTHVGGDRFAANLLVLPYGELYGRVLPFAATDLVARVEAGELVPGLMRGRLGLPPVAQAALVFAHTQLADARRGSIEVAGVDRVDDSLTQVRLTGVHGPLVATIATEWAEPQRLTCRGASAAPARVMRGVRLA